MYGNPELRPARRYLAAFSSAAIILLLGIVVGVALARVFHRQKTLRRSEAVLRTNRELLQRLTDAETGQRGYVIAGEEAYLEPYRGAKADVNRATARLRDLVADDPVAVRILEPLGSVVSERIAVLDERIALRRTGGIAVASAAIANGPGRALMDSARHISAAIEERYSGKLAGDIVEESRDARMVIVVLTTGTVLAAIIALLLNSSLGRTAARQQALVRELGEQKQEVEAQRDELEERTAEAERLRAEAERANRTKAQFLAMISHDLRTPLNAIGGYADLLDAEVAGALSPRQREYVERIVASNRFLTSLIGDVLAFAKAESGSLDLKLEPVVVGRFLATIEPLVAPQIAAADITYGVSYGCGAQPCGAAVLADADKLRQIVLNLVGNAIKFAPKGEIRLACGCDADAVWLAVRDTGPGIPAAKLDTIFEPFVQLDTTLRADSRKGVGLGLAISRELARQMGGELTVSSALGVGSTFTVRLRRHQRALITPPAAPPPPAQARAAAGA